MNGKEYLITTAQEVARENERLITENGQLIRRAERAEAAAEALADALKDLADYVASEIFISGGESIEQVIDAREVLRQYREVTNE